MTRDDLKTRLMMFGISTALFVACAFFALPAIFTDTSRWQAVEGTIIQYDQVFDEIDVHYTYEVKGKLYVGTHATLWSDRLPISQAPKLDRTQAVGRRIQVYHHPTDPTRAVLDPTITTTHKVITAGCTLLTAVGIVGAFLPKSGPR